MSPMIIPQEGGRQGNEHDMGSIDNQQSSYQFCDPNTFRVTRGEKVWGEPKTRDTKSERDVRMADDANRPGNETHKKSRSEHDVRTTIGTTRNKIRK